MTTSVLKLLMGIFSVKSKKTNVHPMLGFRVRMASTARGKRLVTEENLTTSAWRRYVDILYNRFIEFFLFWHAPDMLVKDYETMDYWKSLVAV